MFISKFWKLAGWGLGLALVLVACGDPTPTVKPAATVSVQPTVTASMSGMVMNTTGANPTTVSTTSSIVNATTVSTTSAATSTTVPTNTAPAPTDSAATEAPKPAATANTMQITIEKFAFGPAEISVPVGTKVVWTNKDSSAHTVTNDDKTLNSPLLNQGEKFEFTFNQAGTFEYYCTPHPFMKAKVIVTAR